VDVHPAPAVSAPSLALARYRFARGLRQARSANLALILLLGVIGGTALASLAAARSTLSSYTTLLARSNPSDMNMTLYSPNFTRRFDHLPGVAHVESVLFSSNAFPLSKHDTPIIGPALQSGDVGSMASIDGEYFNQDRVTVVAGRRANPRNANEFMATALAERLMGWHVGQRVRFGFYTFAETSSPKFGTAAVPPAVTHVERLVGTIVFNDQIVQDNVDRIPTFFLFTPAIIPKNLNGTQYIQYSFKLHGGSATVAQVEEEIIRSLPPGTTYAFHVTSVVEGAANRTLRPDALALGVFGAMALLGALLTALQLVARQLRAKREDQLALRALGARRGAIVSDALIAILGSIVVGSVLAIGVAVALSPLSPIGPVRPELPVRIHFDSLVLLGGPLFLIVGTAAAAIALAVRWAPWRRSSRVTRLGNGSNLARVGANAGMPVSAVAGLHFAFESGRGRSAVPVRSVLIGVTLAVAMIGSTLTFGSGLSTLVSHPALYGWNWDYAVNGNGLVPPQAVHVIKTSPLVKAWSPVNFANAQIDGLTVPIILVHPGARVAPPLLAGHEVENTHQIVLGAATLAQLHKKLGDYVTGGYGTKHDYPIYVPQTRMRIVGVATMPAVGTSLTLHTSMGLGAIIDVNIEPAVFARAIRSPIPTMNGPNMVFLRMAAGVSPGAARTFLRHVTAVGNHAFFALPNGEGGGSSVNWLSVQYPAEIINYRSIGDTPLWLAMAFASGVMVAFGLTIVASVRRRRRDLALLKTLGFTRRQIGAAIAWQASASVVVGLLIGIPGGIALGRWLWDLFAHEIYAVPRATVPALSLVLLGVVAVVLANVVAYFPSRSASSTSAAAALRAE
jgi:FtsX-like permease family